MSKDCKSVGLEEFAVEGIESGEQMELEIYRRENGQFHSFNSQKIVT